MMMNVSTAPAFISPGARAAAHRSEVSGGGARRLSGGTASCARRVCARVCVYFMRSLAHLRGSTQYVPGRAWSAACGMRARSVK